MDEWVLLFCNVCGLKNIVNCVRRDDWTTELAIIVSDDTDILLSLVELIIFV